MSKQSSRGQAWEKRRQQVIARDGAVCAYCGKQDLEGADLTVDHVVPKALGGTDALDNCIISCRRCNIQKSDKQLIRHQWFSPIYFDRGV